jgi:hypothetical protein
MGRAGAGQREAGEAAVRRGRARGMAQSGAGAVGARCGRTNSNYTGSRTQVHSRGLQRASNGIIFWPVG